MTKINYSIIIPHKNTPMLLQRCLDSIPRRNDIQIVVIDDNSDPDKVDFAQFPCLNDPSIEIVFTKEGRGAGYARNIGLKKAAGKWILFSDADDYFLDNFLNYTDKYIDSNYDLIYFGIKRIGKKKEKKNMVYKKNNKFIDAAIHNKNIDAYKYTAYSPWGKMIKKQLIVDNSIFFDETLVANDRMFSLKTAYYAKNIFFETDIIYVYNPEESCLTNLQSVYTNFIRFTVYVRTNDFLNQIGQEMYNVNLVQPLLKLVNIRNCHFFFKALAIIKKKKINLFREFYCYIKMILNRTGKKSCKE